MKPFVKSLYFSIKGIREIVIRERNFRIQVLAAVGTIGLGFILRLNSLEWALMSLAIGMVFVAEAFNTAIEKLADALHPELHPRIALVKDIAAGGVLLAVFTALAIGSLIFFPHL